MANPSHNANPVEISNDGPAKPLEAPCVRRSDRIELEIHIEVRGIDSRGADFMEETRTEMVSRHGAAIVLKRKLIRDQEVTIRNLSCSQETEARVVGLLGDRQAGLSYGIAFLDSKVNIWGIDFPPLSESEQAAARVLLECARCHRSELVYLDVPEAEVLETTRSLTRPCKRCLDSSVWKIPHATAPAEPPRVPTELGGKPRSDLAHAPPRSGRSENRRQHVRVAVKITIGVRHHLLGLDIVTTEDVSRGGVGFKSAKPYPAGAVIAVAVPYAAGAPNVFAPARIAHARQLADEGLFHYGVAHIPVHKGWPGK